MILCRSVCCTVCVYVCGCSYTCAKPQESLHWPRPTHTDRTSLTLPLKKSFCLHTWSNALSLIYCPEVLAVDFFVDFFYVPGSVFSFEHCGTIKRSCFSFFGGVVHLVVDLQTFREIPFFINNYLCYCGAVSVWTSPRFEEFRLRLLSYFRCLKRPRGTGQRSAGRPHSA